MGFGKGERQPVVHVSLVLDISARGKPQANAARIGPGLPAAPSPEGPATCPVASHDESKPIQHFAPATGELSGSIPKGTL
jgi:hypothetical protein